MDTVILHVVVFLIVQLKLMLQNISEQSQAISGVDRSWRYNFWMVCQRNGSWRAETQSGLSYRSCKWDIDYSSTTPDPAVWLYYVKWPQMVLHFSWNYDETCLHLVLCAASQYIFMIFYWFLLSTVQHYFFWTYLLLQLALDNILL